MSKKVCDACGRKFNIKYKQHLLNDGRIICYECLKEIKEEQKRIEEEQKRIEEEQRIHNKEKKLKEELSKSQLSIDEKQFEYLKQLENLKVLCNDITQVKSDVHTISTIMIIYFILFLISLLITIFTFLAITE